MEVGGSSDVSAMKRILLAIATEKLATGDTEVTRSDIVEQGRAIGALENILGAQGDEPPDSSAAKRIGKLMSRFRAQVLSIERTPGERVKFRFGHKKKNVGAKYPLEFLK